MINSRYIEVTSANRNRYRYPNPSQFTLELSLSGRQNTAFDSKDPIFDSVIKYPPPNIDSPLTYPNFGYMFGPTINGGMQPSDTIVSLIPITTNTNRQLNVLPLSIAKNAYVDDILELINSDVSSSSVASHEFRKIVDSELFLNKEILVTTIDGGEPILTTSISLSSSCDIDNLFVGAEIEFTSTTDADLEGVTRTIAYFRGFDNRIFFNEPIDGPTLTSGDELIIKVDVYQIRINNPFSIGALPELSDSCELTDNTTFRIRQGCNQPIQQGTFVSGTTTTFELPVSVGMTDYTGYMLWITSNPIVFSGTLVSGGFVSMGGVQIAGTFTLTGASGFVDDFFNNMTITLTSGNFSGYSYTISDWDQGTETGTVIPGWTSVIVGTTNPVGGDSFIITQPNPSQYRLITSYNTTTRTGTVIAPFSYTNVIGTKTIYAIGSSDTFDILQFVIDNYHPLDYAESIVAQTQATCYEIRLISLTLPNVPLLSGEGGRITFYPYVYVEFRSVSQGTSIYNFNSNNPIVSNNIMFRAPMLYNYQPELASFITLDGNDMIQTLKFQPNDAFLFSVFLPNGELFRTDDDYLSPSIPNSQLQISACFGIKRLGC